MVKGFMTFIFALVLACSLSAHEGHNHDDVNKMVAAAEPELIQKGAEKDYCPICGMNIKHNYKTSHGVYLKDGSTRQYCSLRCFIVDFPSIESQISKIVVTDVKSEKLIDAKSAFYVVGSKVPGTMSSVSTLAFEKEADAKAFVAENGGEVAPFDVAVAKSKASLAQDADEMIKRKQKGMYPMGEKIYNAQCKKDHLNPHDFKTISALKAHIKHSGVCGELEDKELQALSLYLWEVLGHEATSKEKTTTLMIQKDEKCPVCGMFAYKYPKWAARMTYMENGKPIAHAFDGVKDLLKFYQNPSKWGNYTKHPDADLTILVSDYYTGEAMDGMKAFYVVGSDVMGPMGKEFVPFKTLNSAQTFMKDHKGLKIVEFSKIDEALIYAQE